MTRPYYDYEGRGSTWRFGAGITPGVRLLLLANVIAFVILWISESALMIATRGSGGTLIEIFGLSRAGVFQRFMVWQPVTYLFVHGGLLHLLLNMLALWVFGCDVERTWGTRRFFFYYFFTGVGASLFILLLPSQPNTITVGASGAVLGLLVAFAMFFPNRPITLLLFFVFPLTVKAKHLAIGFAVITFFYLIREPSAGGISHLGHFGGMVLGYLYVRYSDSLRARFDDSIRNVRTPRLRVPRVTFGSRTEYTREEVDAILDKIAAKGIDSLSDEEREVLRKASSKMR
jgi:membrane associated rhomboid family serine protease